MVFDSFKLSSEATILFVVYEMQNAVLGKINIYYYNQL